MLYVGALKPTLARVSAFSALSLEFCIAISCMTLNLGLMIIDVSIGHC